MSAGNAQRYEIIMNDQPLFKMHHYITGTSSDKTIWSDEAKTTPLAQPAVADANGMLTFFADGVYRMVFTDSSDVSITGMDYDEFLITADFATTFEANQGTVLPSATADNVGHLFLLLDVSNNILGMYVSDGTQYKSMVAFDSSGNQIFTDVVTKVKPKYDITHPDWGAILNNGLDQTAAVQKVATAISNAGSGLMYCPNGELTINGTLDMNNCSIGIVGDGIGQTVILQKSSPGGPMFDYDATDIKDTFLIGNLSVRSEIGSVTSGDDVLDIAWSSESGNNFEPNCVIKNVNIGPTDATKATSGFDNYVKLTNAKKPILSDCDFRGHTGGTLEGKAVSLNGYTNDITLRNCKASYLAKGVLTADNIDKVTLIDCDINECTDGIDNTVAADIRIIDTKMATSDNGITSSATMTNLEIDNCTITKLASSTEDWTGVLVDAVDYTIGGGKIKDAGSASGTDIGISIVTGTVGIVEGVLVDNIRTDGIKVAAGVTNFDIKGNTINTAVTGINIVAGASDNYMVTDNNLDGCTTPFTDGGTGTNKIIADNLGVGTGTTTVQAIEIAELTMAAPGTQDTLWSKTLAANTAYVIQADIIGVWTAGGSSGSANISALLSLTVEDAGEVDEALTYYYTTGGTYAITGDVSAGDVRIRVTGGSSDMKWKASVRVLEVAV